MWRREAQIDFIGGAGNYGSGYSAGSENTDARAGMTKLVILAMPLSRSLY
jgi:hypothetical protein